MHRLFFILFFVTLNSSAGMLVNKTRVIFFEGHSVQRITIMNVNNYPSFVQVWIDSGAVNNFKQDNDAPFTLIPSIFNLPENELKSIKIIHNGASLPQDRERLFWINIYEVPATNKKPVNKQHLLMSMKTQLKLIYRPKNLKYNLHIAAKAVKCSITIIKKNLLTCYNDSGYYISYNSIKVKLNRKIYNAITELDLMLKPFSDNSFSLVESTSSSAEDNNENDIIFNFIDDNGEVNQISNNIK